MIKAIFWDNDGILVDTERLYFRATQYVLTTVGIPLSKEQYVELFLVQGKGAWQLAADKGVSPSTIEQLRHERNALYSRLLCQQPLVPDGVQGVLDALHGTYVMGIVTSASPTTLHSSIRELASCNTFISCSPPAIIRTVSLIPNHISWRLSAVVVARKSAW